MADIDCVDGYKKPRDSSRESDPRHFIDTRTADSTADTLTIRGEKSARQWNIKKANSPYRLSILENKGPKGGGAWLYKQIQVMRKAFLTGLKTAK